MTLKFNIYIKKVKQKREKNGKGKKKVYIKNNKKK